MAMILFRNNVHLLNKGVGKGMGKNRVMHIGYYHGIDDTRIIHKECKSLYRTGNYYIYYVTSNRNANVGKYNADGVEEEVLPLINIRFVRLFVYIFSLKKKINEYNPQICHIHEFALFPIIPFLRRKRIKIILDFHENDLDKSKFKSRGKYGQFLSMVRYNLLKRYERSCVRSAEKIIVVDYVLKDRINEYGHEAYVIPNYPIINLQQAVELSKLEDDTLCFAGVYSELWSTSKILEVMNRNPNIKFRLAGLGDEKYLNVLKGYSSWNRTIFYGKVPLEVVINKIYPQSSIGMALLQYDDAWKYGPLGNTKIFEFMMAGLPVVATDFPIWKEIIEENNCGICVNCNDIDAISDAVDRLLSNKKLACEMGENGRNLVCEKYNWEILSKRLIDIYSSLR